MAGSHAAGAVRPSRERFPCAGEPDHVHLGAERGESLPALVRAHSDLRRERRRRGGRADIPRFGRLDEPLLAPSLQRRAQEHFAECEEESASEKKTEEDKKTTTAQETSTEASTAAKEEATSAAEEMTTQEEAKTEEATTQTEDRKEEKQGNQEEEEQKKREKAAVGIIAGAVAVVLLGGIFIFLKNR